MVRVGQSDAVGPVVKRGQTGDDHRTAARASGLAAVAHLPSIAVGAHQVALRCRQVAGDFVVSSPRTIEILRLGD